MTNGVYVYAVGKRFRRRDPNQVRTLKELALGGFRRLARSEQFWALQDVSFQVKPGQMLGVIGRNGAGKSTLLRLVGGVGTPDQGHIETRGKVGALIDVGAGYHPDLTGRENVLINGVIAGLTQAEVKRRFEEIVTFAELHDFIDSPLRTYSTGMQMRLAFSVAVHTDPDILLIDEVLAVGDITFQHKCLDRILEFRKRNSAIMLVSHDTGLIRRLCDDAIWLEHGKIMDRGAANRVVDRYIEAMSAETLRRTPEQSGVVRLPDGTELILNENRMGSLEIEVEQVRLTGQNGEGIKWIQSGDCVDVEIQYSAARPVESPIFGVTITNEDDQVLFDTSTASTGLILSRVQGRGSVTLKIGRLDLVPGRYFFDVGIYQQEWEYAYDYHWHVYPLDVEASSGIKGFLNPPHSWKV